MITIVNDRSERSEDFVIEVDGEPFEEMGAVDPQADMPQDWSQLSIWASCDRKRWVGVILAEDEIFVYNRVNQGPWLRVDEDGYQIMARGSEA